MNPSESSAAFDTGRSGLSNGHLRWTPMRASAWVGAVIVLAFGIGRHWGGWW